MTDKEKIIAYIDKLLEKYPKNYYLLTVAEFIDSLQEEPVSNNYSALLPCIYNRTLEERVKYCKYCSAACEGRVKEPVSEDLENEVIKKILYFSENFHKAPWAIDSTGAVMPIWYAKFGAKWQKQQDQETIELAEDHAMLAGMEKAKEQIMKNIWKPADGDDLPEIDREVIVLTQQYPLEGSEYAVYFAHRPNPDGWDGKSLTTGEVEHYTPETYGKGGWNIPDVLYWLDARLPYEEK